MVKKVTIAKPNDLSYQKKIGYKENLLYFERLKKAKSVDLRDNFIINDCGDGYSKISPIDKNKRFN